MEFIIKIAGYFARVNKIKSCLKACNLRSVVVTLYLTKSYSLHAKTNFEINCTQYKLTHASQVLSLLCFSPSTMGSRHSASPVVFTSARSSPKEELHSATSSQLAPSFSSSSSSCGPRTFYPRQGATSKYLIGWKKPEGTINSVGFMDSRK